MISTSARADPLSFSATSRSTGCHVTRTTDPQDRISQTPKRFAIGLWSYIAQDGLFEQGLPRRGARQFGFLKESSPGSSFERVASTGVWQPIRLQFIPVEVGVPVSGRNKRALNGREKFLVIKWLGQKSRGPGVQSSSPKRGIIVGGEHNYTSRGRNVAKLRLNFEAIHHRHPNINNCDR
jgi:hypothetical protein